MSRTSRRARFDATLPLCALGAFLIGVVPAAATHEDGVYDLPVWFTWHKSDLDVFVIPAPHGQLLNDNGLLDGLDPAEAHPCTNSYTRAVVESIQDWKQGVAAFGPTWLKTNLVTNVYVLGCGAPPPPTNFKPEIVVNNDENKGIFLGLACCGGLTSAVFDALEERACLVENSMMLLQSFTYSDMFNVNAHEFGHCLGLHHVGGDHPAHDVMDRTYDDPVGFNNHKHCVSNLDVRGLERVFGGLFGFPSGGTATAATATYITIEC